MKKKSKLKNKCWKWFSLYIRLRDKETCVLCGARREDGYVIQAGHLIPKKKGNAVYFNRFNVFAQCYKCNMCHSYDFTKFEDWYIKKYGQRRYDKLKRISYKKIGKVDYGNRIERYKRKVKELEKTN